MPRTLIYTNTAPWARFSLNAQQLALLPGLPPAQERPGMIKLRNMPLEQLRLAVNLARGKQMDPLLPRLLPGFFVYVLSELQFSGTRAWLSESGLSARFVLASDAKLYRFTNDLNAWVHPMLLPLLHAPDSSNLHFTQVLFDKPITQFVAPSCGDGALAVLFDDHTVLAHVIWGGFTEVLNDDEGDVEYTEDFEQVVYDKYAIVSMRFVFPDLLLQTANNQGGGVKDIRMVPDGEEHY
jgi:hypothetical protein